VLWIQEHSTFGEVVGGYLTLNLRICRSTFPAPTSFQKMDNLLRAVIAVPKAEIDEREKEWKRAGKRKKAVKR